MGFWDRIFGEREGSESTLEFISDPEGLKALLSGEISVLYKHSAACWASFGAIRQMETFSRNHPEIPVGMIDVITHRDLSRAVETHIGVRHESPQAILFFRGKPVWNASHSRVKEALLEEQVDLLKDA